MVLNARKSSVALLAAGIVFSSSVLAEAGGQLAARSADLSQLPDSSVVEGIVSGRAGVGSNPDLQWYSNLGFTRIKAPRYSETEVSFGAGLLLPTATGEIYGGIEHIDEIFFGFGYRHFL